MYTEDYLGEDAYDENDVSSYDSASSLDTVLREQHRITKMYKKSDPDYYTFTHIVDFKNFVLPEANTLVSSRLSIAENEIASFKTTFNTSYDRIITENTSINANFVSLSSRVANSSLEYYGKCSITIEQNNTQSTGLLSPSLTPKQLSNLTTEDIIIFPRNAYAAKFEQIYQKEKDLIK
jgi:hypothetical protein